MICGCRQHPQQQVLSGSTTTFVAPYIRDELAFLFLVDMSTLIISLHHVLMFTKIFLSA